MVSRALGSTGTSTVCPALCTLAWAVPMEIVDTGTLAALAAAIASASDRPVVLFPSDSRTMRAAGALVGSVEADPWPADPELGPVVGTVPAGRAARAVKMASPRAVPGLVASRSRATSTAW